MQTTFHGLHLALDPGVVMAPRAATEALVDAALARVGRGPARVADVGTGTGAVAVALAVRAPACEVWATDTSVGAVALARANAARHGVAGRVRVARGDLLDSVPHELDLVVANLPYLPAARRRPEYDGEPDEAVYSPGDGLAHYRRLLARADRHLAPGGGVLVQFRARVYGGERGRLRELARALEGAAVEYAQAQWHATTGASASTCRPRLASSTSRST